MILLSILVPILVISIVVRVILRVLFGFRRSYRRGPYGYGRRRRGFGGGLVSILGLVALERLFDNRRW